jgi:hypothetical protein
VALDTNALDTNAIWSALVEVEELEQLIDWRIGQIHVWPILRERLFRELAERNGVIEKRVEEERTTKDSRAWQQAWPKIPELAAETLVIPFLRRDEAGVDQFSSALSGAYRDSVASLSVGPCDIAEPTPQLEDIEDFVRTRYRSRAKLQVALSLRPWHFTKYARLVAAIASRVGGVGPKYSTLPKWLLVDFLAQKLGFYDLFRAAGTRRVVYVNAWRRGLIAGARAAGAKVIEPQHGAISRLHSLLSWPVDSTPAYLPDAFLAWGQYWVDSCGLPRNVKTLEIGAPSAFARVRNQLADGTLRVDPQHIVIASQVQQTQAIIEFANCAAATNPNYKFSFKPHPQEDMALVASLLDGGLSNLTLVDPNQALLPLIAASGGVIGVFSTALFEAAALGKAVGIIKLSGWQHAEVLLTRGDAREVSDGDISPIQGFKPTAAAANYYYARELGESTEAMAAIKQRIDELAGVKSDR